MRGTGKRRTAYETTHNGKRHLPHFRLRPDGPQAVVLLYVMSIPRRVVVGDTALEIRCIVEITHIKYADLRSIRRIPPETMKKKFVFFGSYGFFGYYGYYIDGKSWETLKLYCKQWDNFIEITDAYEKRYIISSPAPDDLVAAVTRAIRYYSDSAPGE